MAAQANAAPIIIKRKKGGGGDGHHGGAWKVAYADFVTAMMAFFMLMWLLNATTEKQRKGIADYFSPTIPLSRISGGGDGSFGGDNVSSNDQIAQKEANAQSEATADKTEKESQSGEEAGEDSEAKEEFEKEARKIEEALMGIGGESMVSDDVLRHITTRVTDEGLIIEFFDIEGAPLFEPGTSVPMPVTTELAGVVSRVFDMVKNQVAINGHIRAQTQVLRNNPAWDLSSERAMQMRILMEASGFETERIQRVAGFADRKPALRNPLAERNNRLEIILLRKGQ